jgi:transcriptional regulator with XRE-family HTH domain
MATVTPSPPGLRVRIFRTWRGLTLAELAERTGISQAGLSRLENSREPQMKLPTHKAQRLAAALGVELNALIGSDGFTLE